MPSESFEFTEPDRVTVGTVGTPGRRVFLLQAQAAESVATLKLEKQQVLALSEALLERLEDLAISEALPTDLELRPPFEVAWVVGAMGLGYLDALDRIVLDAAEAVPVDEEGEPTEPGARARVLLTRAQARALAVRASELVASGRPPCPLCGHPLDPSGHTCPKTNGHHAPER
jgi:uncharacterized repeat protein (TIGR03847 family)